MSPRFCRSSVNLTELLWNNPSQIYAHLLFTSWRHLLCVTSVDRCALLDWQTLCSQTGLRRQSGRRHRSKVGYEPHDFIGVYKIRQLTGASRKATRQGNMARQHGKDCIFHHAFHDFSCNHILCTKEVWQNFISLHFNRLIKIYNLVWLCKSPVILGDSTNLWSLHEFMEMTLAAKSCWWLIHAQTWLLSLSLICNSDNTHISLNYYMPMLVWYYIR